MAAVELASKIKRERICLYSPIVHCQPIAIMGNLRVFRFWHMLVCNSIG